jgi:hypothetical protein
VIRYFGSLLLLGPGRFDPGHALFQAGEIFNRVPLNNPQVDVEGIIPDT